MLSSRLHPGITIKPMTPRVALPYNTISYNGHSAVKHFHYIALYMRSQLYEGALDMLNHTENSKILKGPFCKRSALIGIGGGGY